MTQKPNLIEQRQKELQTTVATEMRDLIVSTMSPAQQKRLQNVVAHMAVYSPQVMQECSPEAIVKCLHKAVQHDIVPDNKEAAIVMVSQSYQDADGSWKKRKVPELWVMVAGAKRKISEHPDVEFFACEAIHQNDRLKLHHFSDKMPEIECGDPFQRGAVVGACAAARLRSGDVVTFVIGIEEARARYLPQWMQDPKTEKQKKAVITHYSSKLPEDWITNCACKTFYRKLPAPIVNEKPLDNNLFSQSEQVSDDFPLDGAVLDTTAVETVESPPPKPTIDGKMQRGGKSATEAPSATPPPQQGELPNWNEEE